MQALFDEGKPEDSLDVGENAAAYDSYTADDFLQDVYMDEERYQTLKALLAKKNIILQSAPGVGKTFAAKRLAYSIMGKKIPPVYRWCSSTRATATNTSSWDSGPLRRALH